MQEDDHPDSCGNSRRTFLKTVGITMGTASIEAATVAAKADTNDTSVGQPAPWTTARSKFRRTGAITATDPTPYAKTNWKMDLDGSMYSVEPIIKDEMVYLAATTNNGPTDSEGYIGAYDTKTGEQQWRQSNLPAPRYRIANELLQLTVREITRVLHFIGSI
ncbi:hypothetical protein [Haladaptatus caseinilyticus]|uniref:hypothetical protein n=1 Tax=Haladaptatus caseinilyticus TaxID=2993314 RepID=UPI00224ADDE0|nr:hypothetical protein [Haladaptatus caseinilyticus]